MYWFMRINLIHSYFVISMDACYNNPCLNNGTCTHNGHGSALYSCTDDWTGSRCECKFFLLVLYDVITMSNICLFNTL